MFETGTRHGPGRPIESGDLFFGQFTGVGNNNELVADQSVRQDSLIIEAFAWDSVKGYFNFYEFLGNGSEGQWFYRSDSLKRDGEDKVGLHGFRVPVGFLLAAFAMS